MLSLSIPRNRILNIHFLYRGIYFNTRQFGKRVELYRLPDWQENYHIYTENISPMPFLSSQQCIIMFVSCPPAY